MSNATTTPSNIGYTAPKCGLNGNAQSIIPHNDPLHIIALFVILTVSASAAIFPIVATRNPRLHIPSKLLFILKHFGTGVLVATAFCHLLPTAFISLLDPCLQTVNPTTGLPDGKGVLGLGGSYPALSGAVAMAGVFIVATVEMVFAEVVGGKERHHHHRSDIADGVRRSSTFGRERNLTPVGTSLAMATATGLAGITPSTAGGLEGSGVMSGIMVSAAGSKMDMQGAFLRCLLFRGYFADESINELESRAETIVDKDEYACNENDDQEMANDPMTIAQMKEKNKKAILQCFLLEMGILFHSIFIGLALRYVRLRVKMFIMMAHSLCLL